MLSWAWSEVDLALTMLTSEKDEAGCLKKWCH